MSKILQNLGTTIIYRSRMMSSICVHIYMYIQKLTNSKIWKMLSYLKRISRQYI